MDIVKEKKFESDHRLAERIRLDDKGALEELFFEYYSDLCAFAFGMIKSNEQAKDIVQDVFYNVWKRRQEVEYYRFIKSLALKEIREKIDTQPLKIDTG